MKGYYIDENENGDIICVFSRKQRVGQKKLKGDNEKLIAHLKKIDEDIKLQNDIELKIEQRMRSKAIQELKDENEIPQDY